MLTVASGPAWSEAASSRDGSTRPRSPPPDSLWCQAICETCPVNIADTIDGARRAFEIAGRGCLVWIGENEPRYVTVAEVASHAHVHAAAGGPASLPSRAGTGA
jgi:hypothetical protein